MMAFMLRVAASLSSACESWKSADSNTPIAVAKRCWRRDSGVVCSVSYSESKPMPRLSSWRFVVSAQDE